MHQTQRLKNIPLWDARWNHEALKTEKGRNPRAFDRGFHMRAYTDDERKFPSFRQCYVHGVCVGDIARRGWPVFVGVDLAGQKRPGTAIMAAAMDPATRRRYPLEIMIGKWSSPETASRIADINYRYNVRYIIVENNAYQQSLIDWIRYSCADHSFWVKVEPFTTGQNKANVDYGLPSLEVEFKNKAWVIPSDEFETHEPGCQCGWCRWSRQMVDYPMAAESDAVMATWFCREAIDRWGGFGASVALGDFNSR